MLIAPVFFCELLVALGVIAVQEGPLLDDQVDENDDSDEQVAERREKDKQVEQVLRSEVAA